MFVEAINCTDGKHPLRSRLCAASLYRRDASYSGYSNSKSYETDVRPVCTIATDRTIRCHSKNTVIPVIITGTVRLKQ